MALAFLRLAPVCARFPLLGGPVGGRFAAHLASVGTSPTALKQLPFDGLTVASNTRGLVHTSGDIVTFAPGALVAGSRAFAAKAKQRDPERPKRPTSPWLGYLAVYRKQNTNLGNKEVMAKAAASWKTLSLVDKAPYVKAYDVEKKKYEEAFKSYKESGKLEAWKRDPEKPKKPATAFMLFAAEVRSQNPQVKMTEQTKIASAKWKTMSAQSKLPYEQKAANEAAAHKEAMNKYKDSGKEAAWKEKKGLVGKSKEQAVKDKAKLLKEKAKAREVAKKAKEKELKAKQKAKEAAKKAKDAEKKAKDKAKAAAKKKQATLATKLKAAKAKLAAAPKKAKSAASSTKAKSARTSTESKAASSPTK